MAGAYLRGAFVSFTELFPLPVPNVVIFQYNPETMTHTWSPAQAGGAASTAAAHPASAAGGAASSSPPDGASNPLAVTGPPGESFSFTLTLDANDMIADGNLNPPGAALAEASGVYTRLAALEMLLFPTASPGKGLVGSISSALGLSSSSPGPSTPIPSQQLPTVLFIWGPGRILPVKLTSLTTTEKLYAPLLLNPIHAEVAVGLKVLTPQELQYVDGPLGGLAKTAYDVSQTLRETLALANLVNGVGDIIGMLPI